VKKHAGIFAVCGLALAAGVYVGNTVTAQGNPGGAAVVARTRIAFVNINEVIKAYPKYNNLQEVVKQKDKFYMDKLKALDDKLKELQKAYQNPATPQTERDKIEAQARLIKADMENITNDAKKDMIKFHDDNMAQVFMEIDTVVREYASTNGIDVVFRYSEDWNKDTYHKPENIVRRMTVPIWVMYKDNNLDITQAISKNLNNRFSNAAVAPPGAAGSIQQTGGTVPGVTPPGAPRP
jgi:Skp family chaperone for outer membrane proteins